MYVILMEKTFQSCADKEATAFESEEDWRHSQSCCRHHHYRDHHHHHHEYHRHHHYITTIVVIITTIIITTLNPSTGTAVLASVVGGRRALVSFLIFHQKF